jgi:ATP-binding cassette subfamily C (CFTR/MRP) protein 4
MTDINTSPYVLKNVSLDLKSGQLLGVCGMVGAGKSSLINAILGELEPEKGSVFVRTKQIGYVGQSPWILSGSIKENILFGKEFKQEWFESVIKNCALEEDLEQMPDRENTIVGERGVTLSGGQRARIALARAVYCDADIYLLDDPLSAVDAKVGRFIFNNCIKGILKSKCILLVSHQLQYVKNCDIVALIENGELKGLGPYEVVMEIENSDFAGIMKDFATDPDKFNHVSKTSEYEITEENMVNDEDLKATTNVNNISEEISRKGAVTLSVYVEYLKSDSPYYMLIFLFILLILAQGLLLAAVYWLGAISQLSEQIQFENRDRNVSIYIGIVVVAVIFAVIRALWFYSNCINSGRLFFSKMLTSVFRAPIDFFHVNPHGRIMK